MFFPLGYIGTERRKGRLRRHRTSRSDGTTGLTRSTCKYTRIFDGTPVILSLFNTFIIRSNVNHSCTLFGEWNETRSLCCCCTTRVIDYYYHPIRGGGNVGDGNNEIRIEMIARRLTESFCSWKPRTCRHAFPTFVFRS